MLGEVLLTGISWEDSTESQFDWTIRPAENGIVIIFEKNGVIASFMAMDEDHANRYVGAINAMLTRRHNNGEGHGGNHAV